METIDSLHRLQAILEMVSGILKSAETLSDTSEYAWLKKENEEARIKLSDRSFYLGLLGEFKRGKSTLLNALTGTDFIPAGVVPLTSIITAVRYGERPEARAIFHSGEQRQIDPHEISSFVTESKNPKNEKGVERVELLLSRDILKDGLVLLDTPGVGSFYEHNTQLTYAWLSRLDAAFFLLSPDPPVSKSEIEFLREVLRYVPRVFLVLNKVDRLDVDSLAEIIAFSKQTLQQALGTRFEIHPLSARAALAAQLENNPSALEESGLASLREELEQFLIRNKGKVFMISMIQKTDRILETLLLSLHSEIELSATPLLQLESRLAAVKEIQQNLEQRIAELMILLRHQQSEMKRWLDQELEAFVNRAVTELDSQLAQFNLEQDQLQKTLAEWLRKQLEERTFTALEDLEGSLQNRMNKSFQLCSSSVQEIATELVQNLRAILSFSLEIPMETPVLQPRGAFWIAIKDPLEHVSLSAYSYFTYLRKSSGKKRLLRTYSQSIRSQAESCSGKLRLNLAERIDQCFQAFHRSFERNANNALQAISTGILRAMELHSYESTERKTVTESAREKIKTLEQMREELSVYRKSL